MDIVDKQTRSRMMASIRSKDTGPEKMVRSLLFKKGIRYRLNDRKLRGSPDIVFPKFKALIFVHGCFWHGHDCHFFSLPKTRKQFWKDKIEKNCKRDEVTERTLSDEGWRIGKVWECSLRGKKKIPESEMSDGLVNWLRGNQQNIVFSGI